MWRAGGEQDPPAAEHENSRKRRRVGAGAPAEEAEMKTDEASASHFHHLSESSTGAGFGSSVRKAYIEGAEEEKEDLAAALASDSDDSEDDPPSPLTGEQLDDVLIRKRHAEEFKQIEAFKQSDLYQQSCFRNSRWRGSIRGRNLLRYVWKQRESGVSRAAHRVCISQRFIPNATKAVGINQRPEIVNTASRIYCSQFSRDGSMMLIAGQDADIRIFDVDTWTQIQSIPARNVRWTISDCVFTQDQKFVLYSSLTSVVHIANTVGDFRRHEALDISEGVTDDSRVFCVRMSSSGLEFVAALQDKSVVIYDIERKKTVIKLPAHENDVNTVAFADNEHKSNIILSGSDDCLIKIWDRRLMSNNSCKPIGAFVGHTAGVTYVSPKGDGVYFVSNGKDQTTKLWDIRRMHASSDTANLPRVAQPYQYDYRFEGYPGFGNPVFDAADNSVMTYRGHIVLETLVRVYFSPESTSGQRFLYSGSADGRIFIYDVLTGKLVDTLSAHRSAVRDACWHPDRPMLCSSSFDGTVLKWEHDRQVGSRAQHNFRMNSKRL